MKAAVWARGIAVLQPVFQPNETDDTVNGNGNGGLPRQPDMLTAPQMSISRHRRWHRTEGTSYAIAVVEVSAPGWPGRHRRHYEQRHNGRSAIAGFSGDPLHLSGHHRELPGFHPHFSGNATLLARI